MGCRVNVVTPVGIVGDYRRPHVYSIPQSRGSYFTFLLTGGLLGSVLLVGLGLGAALLPSPPLWFGFGLLTAWWLLSIVAATWRRLMDAGADPWLALAWPFLPVAAAVGAGWPLLLNGLQILRVNLEGMIPIIIGSAAVFSGVLLVIVLGVCATPTGQWRWPGARLMFWIAVVYSPFLALVVWLLVRVIRRIGRPNLGTRLGLLASFVGLCFAVGAEYLDPVTRAVVLVIVGIVFTGFHLLRWILQERHFDVSRVTVDFAGREGYETADPRWRPWSARVFKSLSIVWIWTVVVSAITRDPAEGMQIVWVVLLTGYLIYLVAPAIPAGFGTVFLIMANWSDADHVLRGFVVPLLIVWGLSAVWFGLIWFFVPTDRRFNFTRDYWRHLSKSEW